MIAGGVNGHVAQPFIESSARSWAETDIKELLTTGKVSLDEAKGDTDMKHRQETINKAMQYFHDQVLMIPLHLQVIPWAARANVEVTHRADNWLQATWVNIK